MPFTPAHYTVEHAKDSNSVCGKLWGQDEVERWGEKRELPESKGN